MNPIFLNTFNATHSTGCSQICSNSNFLQFFGCAIVVYVLYICRSLRNCSLQGGILDLSGLSRLNVL